MFVCPVPKISQVKMKRRRRASHLGRDTTAAKLLPSSETQGQIVGARESLNGRKNIWHEEK